MTATMQHDHNSVAVKRSLWAKLYNGETTYEFVRRWKRWFLVSAVVIAIGLVSLVSRGLNLGIDFKGGTVWEFERNGLSVGKTRDAVGKLGIKDVKVQTVGGSRVRVQGPKTEGTERENVTAGLAKLAKIKNNEVSVSFVGPSWGKDVSKKAQRALVVFFVLIAGFIAFRFEWKMALAAMAAVVHDILITMGVYSLSGLSVTPATVIAFLTILGYSLYDTIVVFDKVEENVKAQAGSGRMTYSDLVNVSMNEVLMRSINTSLVAILPILSMLIFGYWLAGATALGDFGLALFIGLLTGAYSSIFIAAPLLALLKEREPKYAQLREKLGSKAVRISPASLAAAGRVAAPNAGSGTTVRQAAPGEVLRPGGGTRPGASAPIVQPRPRKQGKKR